MPKPGVIVQPPGETGKKKAETGRIYTGPGRYAGYRLNNPNCAKG